MLNKLEDSEESAAEAAADTEASPDNLEDASEDNAVDSETSPETREEAAELSAVDRDVSPESLEDASDVTDVPSEVTMEVTVVWKSASSFNAAANSLRVSRDAGAPSIRFVSAVLMSTEILVTREASAEDRLETDELKADDNETSPEALEETSELNTVEIEASAF